MGKGHSPLASMRRLYKKYVWTCRKKNHFWELPLELFHKLTSLNCEYCGRKPTAKSRSYTYNGLDRKDNKKGYTPDNVVPCCWECNHLKGHLLTHEEAKVALGALSAFRKRIISPP